MNFIDNSENVLPDNDVIGLTYGQQNQISVLGRLARNPSQVVVFCSVCVKDKELFGHAIFRTELCRLDMGRFPCGCSPRPHWNKDQYAVLCRRKAESINFKFLGFSGNFIGQKTKIELLCNKHKHVWNTTSVVNFLYSGGGCDPCRREKASAKIAKDVNHFTEKFIKTGCFPDGTKFEKLNYNKWKVYCPVCAEESLAFTANLRKGCLPCACGRQSQTKAYIHLVKDGESFVAIKFGVSNNPKRRLLEQDSATIFDVTLHSVWTFNSVSDCKKAESMCKSLSKSPALTKESFPNGFTETLPVIYLDSVIKIYKEYGGELLF